MIAHPLPIARSLIVCERIVSGSAERMQIDLIHVVTTIRPKLGEQYPLLQTDLGIFAQLTECRGSGRIRVQFQNADTEALVYQTPDRLVVAPNQPLTVHGVVFRLRNLPFHEPGLYWVQLCYDDNVIAQTPITLLPGSFPPPPRGV